MNKKFQLLLTTTLTITAIKKYGLDNQLILKGNVENVDWYSLCVKIDVSES